jgi:pimeloyl-ACP methyl ester carboxylesterase
MPFLQVPNGKLYYENHGQGRTLVLLHGMWSNHGVWRKMVPELARNYEVILLDHMGHGKSGRMQTPYRLATYASDLGHLLDSLERSKVTLLGFSLGASVAQETYFQKPSIVEALVLVATPPPYKMRWMIGIQFVSFLEKLGITSLKRETIKALGRRYSKGTDKGFIQKSLNELSSCDDNEFTRLLRSAWDRGNLGREARIRVPTHIMVGEKDGIRGHSVTVQQAIPGSRLSIVPGCDHSVLFDRPDWVVREILAFLDEIHPNP